MDEAIITAISLMGVVVGFALNEYSARSRYMRERNDTLRLEQKLWWMNYLDRMIALNDEFFETDFEKHPEKIDEMGGKIGIRLKASGLSEIDSKFDRLVKAPDITAFCLLSREIFSEEVRRAAAIIRELESA